MEQISPTLLKGKITELKCELWFLEQGYLVLNPDIPYQYDMVVDIGHKLLKIQVKTCRYEEGGIIFNTSSMTHNNSGYTRRAYSQEAVDYFMTCYENNFYLVPLNRCGTRAKKLRIVPPKNGHSQRIDYASDFLAEKILEREEVTE